MAEPGTPAALRAPPRVRSLLASEALERLAFHGLRAVLVLHLTGNLFPAASDGQARAWYHAFLMVAYLAPPLGGWLSERRFGPVAVALGGAAAAVAGYAVIGLSAQPAGLLLGLGLVACGAGAMSPCGASLVDAQLGPEPASAAQERRLLRSSRRLVQLAAVTAALLFPWLLRTFPAPLTYAAPALLVAVSALAFWLGARHAVRPHPPGPRPHGFLSVLASAVRKLGTHRSGEHWLDAARARHPAEAVEAVGAVLRGGVILAAAAVFYALYDQTGSSWVLQGRRLAPLPPLDLSFAGLGAVTVEAAQLQALAPALALLALPLLDRLVSPALARRGRDLSPLRKVTAGLLLAAAAFAAAGAIHAVADTGRTVSLAWQLPPYLLLACAEVLVAVTGLEWCLAGAPPGARPTIRALWSLAAFAGNLLAFLVQLTRLSPVASFLFFAVVALVFALALRHLFLRRLAPAGAPG